MATIHIRQIRDLLRAELDSEDGSFIEIRFDEPSGQSGIVDLEMSNRVITVDAPQGSVTIVFDEMGLLRSLDIS